MKVSHALRTVTALGFAVALAAVSRHAGAADAPAADPAENADQAEERRQVLGRHAFHGVELRQVAEAG